MKRAMLILLILLIGGCASYGSFIESLNERQLQSCIAYQGGMRAGILSGGNLFVNGVTATGGATIDVCEQMFSFF